MLIIFLFFPKKKALCRVSFNTSSFNHDHPSDFYADWDIRRWWRFPVTCDVSTVWARYTATAVRNVRATGKIELLCLSFHWQVWWEMEQGAKYYHIYLHIYKEFYAFGLFVGKSDTTDKHLHVKLVEMQRTKSLFSTNTLFINTIYYSSEFPWSCLHFSKCQRTLRVFPPHQHKLMMKIWKPVTSRKAVTSTEIVSSFTFLCLCKSCCCSSVSTSGGSKQDVKSCVTRGAIHQLHSGSLLPAFCGVGHKMKTYGKSHLYCGTERTSSEIAAVTL